MFIEALFTIVPKWKQIRCSSTETRINKIQYIHIMEYYIGNNKEVLI